MKQIANIQGPGHSWKVTLAVLAIPFRVRTNPGDSVYCATRTLPDFENQGSLLRSGALFCGLPRSSALRFDRSVCRVPAVGAQCKTFRFSEVFSRIFSETLWLVMLAVLSRMRFPAEVFEANLSESDTLAKRSRTPPWLAAPIEAIL